MSFWQKIGDYEYEVDKVGKYTGRYRCIGGRLSNGKWPVWNINGVVNYQ